MAARSSGGVLQSQLNILSSLGVAGDLTDGQLLGRYLSPCEGGAQAAFTALVERHGPMVLKVCRQVLGDSHDAEDAFQATFLVLLRKAGSVRNADSVASWLHGVAYRVSRRAKADAIQRRAHERRVAEMRAFRHDREADRPESWTELHEEIARLPARYREPLVLCYLEGLTTGVVAQRLRCPQGTILSRLSRGRERLRARLTRRGLAPVNSLVTEAPPPDAEATSVPGPLLSATVQLGTRFLDQPAAAAPVSASVASLTEGVLQAMFWTKLKASGLVGLALATLAVGAGAALAYQEKKERRVVRSQKAPQEPATPAVRPPDAARPTGSSAAAFVPLPPRGELHQLLRRASSEAIALAKAKPMPSSWCLTTIASVQAKAGDLDGARATFADAAKEAEGGSAAPPAPGTSGASVTSRPSAASRRRPADPPAGCQGHARRGGRLPEGQLTVRTLAVIVEEQARLGPRRRTQDGRTAPRVLQEVFRVEPYQQRPRRVRPANRRGPRRRRRLRGRIPVVRRRAEWRQRPGQIAETASKTLDREAARRFVREAAERLAKMQSADETYFGLSDLAEAQARLGDVEGAKRSAKAIGEGPSRGGYDMTDGQPYALIRSPACSVRPAIPSGRGTRSRGLSLGERPPADEGATGGTFRSPSGRSPTATSRARRRRLARWRGSGPRSSRPSPVAMPRRDDKAARTTFARALIDARRTAKDPPSPNPELAKMPGVSQNMSASALMELAEIQAMTGDVPGALKTVRSIDDPNYRRFALESVVSARATAGDVAGALRLGLDESKTPEERRSALEGLGRGSMFACRSNGPRAAPNDGRSAPGEGLGGNRR